MDALHAIIIDPDIKQFQILKSAIKSIHNEADVFSFKDVRDFFTAYKNSLGPQDEADKNDNTVVRLDFSRVRLIIADVDSTHKIDQSLWQKFLKQLEKHQKEQKFPIRFFYTSYDNDGEFNPHNYHSNLVYNILIKPLDPVIVEQMISLALNKEGPLKVKDLYQQKQPTIIELIKDIEIDRLTELGFRTISKRPIELKKIARYFGELF